MGIGGIGIGPLLVILLIVVLIFGTKKLSSMGTDLGSAIKGFKKGLSDDESKENEDESEKKLDSAESTGAESSTVNSESAEAASSEKKD